MTKEEAAKRIADLSNKNDEWGGVTEAGTWTSSSSMC